MAAPGAKPPGGQAPGTPRSVARPPSGPPPPYNATGSDSEGEFDLKCSEPAGKLDFGRNDGSESFDGQIQEKGGAGSRAASNKPTGTPRSVAKFPGGPAAYAVPPTNFDPRAPPSASNAPSGGDPNKGETNIIANPGGCKCNDIAFAILFILFIIGYIVLLGATSKYNFLNYRPPGPDVYSNGTYVPAPAPAPDQRPPQADGREASNTRAWFVMLAIMLIIGLIASLICMFLLYKFTKPMIYIAFIANIVFTVIIAIISFATGGVWLGICLLIIAVFLTIFLWAARRRIPFTAEMIKAVLVITRRFPAMVIVAYLVVIISLGMFFVWLVGASAAVNMHSFGILVFCAFVFYWVSQVMKNYVHVICVGVYGTWYFQSNNMPTNPTLKSMKRASTTSFGSICFGSFIIAMIQLLRFLARTAIDARRNPFLACIIDCILGCIEGIARYFNMYAFTHVALYGKTYWRAAKDTWAMFQESTGFEMIVNDNFVPPVLSMTCVFAGVMCAFIAGIWAAVIFGRAESGSIVGAIILAFVIAFYECEVIAEVVRSGICAIFVALAQSPEVLMRNQPELFATLRNQYEGNAFFQPRGPQNV